MKNAFTKKMMSLAMAALLGGGAVLASHGSASAALSPEQAQVTQPGQRDVKVFPAAVLAGALIAAVGFVAKELYDEGKQEGAADARKRAQAPQPYTDKLRHCGRLALGPEEGMPLYASLLLD